MKVLSDLAINKAKKKAQIARALYGNPYIISCHRF
jgi:hypothetical protein